MASGVSLVGDGELRVVDHAPRPGLQSNALRMRWQQREHDGDGSATDQEQEADHARDDGNPGAGA
jgi:hypothetical protein